MFIQFEAAYILPEILVVRFDRSDTLVCYLLSTNS